MSFIVLLARYLNFTIEWQHPGPLLWGELLDNGTYTGLVGQVRKIGRWRVTFFRLEMNS